MIIHIKKATVHLSGRIEYTDVSQLNSELADVLESIDEDLKINMLRCSYVHSSVLGSLLKALQVLNQRNQAVQLINPPSAFVKIIKLANLLNLFQISHPNSRVD